MDLAALWPTVDMVAVGRRLKAARRAASLTQADVAGDSISAAYLSRIEAGQRRPDLELFRALAARIEIPAERLLSDDQAEAEFAAVQLEVDYAELELATGEIAAALARVQKVLQRDDAPAGLRRAALRVQAGALEAQGDLQGAIEGFAALAAAGPSDLWWLKDLIALCRCYRDSGDFARAIGIGDEAREEIDRLSLAGTTEAIQLTVTVASAHAAKDDLTYAIQLCREAVAKAEEVDSPLGCASAYWNASIFESRQGNTAGAVPLARRALHEFERSEDGRNLGRLRSQLGSLLLRLDRADDDEDDEAIDTLLRAEVELRSSSAGRLELARNDHDLAWAYLRQGETEKAVAHLESAKAGLAGVEAPLIAADIRTLEGQIAFEAGAVEEARARFQEAAGLLSGVGADRRTGEVWYRLADLLETVGDTAGALAAYRSAAASAGLAHPGQGRRAKRPATPSAPADLPAF